MVQTVRYPPAPLAYLPVVAFVSKTTTTTTNDDRREMEESALEILCNGIQGILNKFGYKSSIVAGGYVAGANVLLTLSDTLFVNAFMIDEIRRVYECKVYATAGAIMLNNPVIEYPLALLPQQCQEIDIMQLIADVELRAIEHQGAAACSEK
jgi:hypothetical protein